MGLFGDMYEPDDYPAFQSICKNHIHPVLRAHYPEYETELRGMVAGANHHGIRITLEFLVEWNSLLSVDGALPSSKHKSSKRRERCSAFIATGSATQHGDIVMAHNTHFAYSFAPFSHIVQYMTPANGHAFCMQTLPGLLCSSVDWFITGAGIVGCESTIADTTYTPDFTQHPYFCRIRQAMQYASSLDQYVETMTHSNAGDYPCAWLFGDIHTGEIMLLELGLRTRNMERKKNGVFYTANRAIGRDILSKETDDSHRAEPTTSSGARMIRLRELLTQTYHGKIDAAIAKRILADHYDVSLQKIHKGPRSICRHMECSSEAFGTHPPKDAYGTIDGKVVTTAMAKKMRFWGRQGSSCGGGDSRKECNDAVHPPIFPWTLLDNRSGR